MRAILDISKKVWCWIKRPIYIVVGIFIFLGVTQLVETFGADASNKFAGIFTPLIVAVVTIYLSNRQHNIADAQRAVAEESKNIADAQRAIAKQKIRLDLFDKRYKMYQEIFNLFDDFLHLNSLIDEFVNYYEDDHSGNIISTKEKMADIEANEIDVHAKMERMKRFLNETEFLFCKEAREQLRDLISIISISLSNISIYTAGLLDGIDNHRNNLIDVKTSYLELLSILKPYMDLSDIK